MAFSYTDYVIWCSGAPRSKWTLRRWAFVASLFKYLRQRVFARRLAVHGLSCTKCGSMSCVRFSLPRHVSVCRYKSSLALSTSFSKFTKSFLKRKKCNHAAFSYTDYAIWCSGAPREKCLHIMLLPRTPRDPAQNIMHKTVDLAQSPRDPLIGK